MNDLENRRPILVDLDDTLCNFSSVACIELNRVFSKQLSPADWHTYDLSVVYGPELTQQDIVTAMTDTCCMEKCSFYDASIVDKILRMIYNLEYFPVIATSRNWHPDAERITKNMFNQHSWSVPFKIHVMPYHELKVDQYPNARLLIDDSSKQIKGAQEKGVETIAVLRPWTSLNYLPIGEHNAHDIFSVAHTLKNWANAEALTKTLSDTRLSKLQG